ncbi:MAG: hypothetical protein ACMUHY_09130, partial [Thermoplasmatota archaeon]
VLVPEDGEGAPNWQGKHLYADQWLYFEIGALDQNDEVEYGVIVSTPDESVNVAIMDSTNYAAFDSADFETFVGHEVQWQVRSLESSAVIPYQQIWYFVVISDNFPYSEIDIEYYVEVVEEDDGGGICGGAMVAGALMIIAMLGIVSIIRRR